MKLTPWPSCNNKSQIRCVLEQRKLPIPRGPTRNKLSLDNRETQSIARDAYVVDDDKDDLFFLVLDLGAVCFLLLSFSAPSCE